MSEPTKQSERPLHNRIAAIRGCRRPSAAPKVSREILMNASPTIRALLSNEIALRASRNSSSNNNIASSGESSQLAGIQAEHVNYAGFSFPARNSQEPSSSGSSTYEHRAAARTKGLMMDSQGEIATQTGIYSGPASTGNNALSGPPEYPNWHNPSASSSKATSPFQEHLFRNSRLIPEAPSIPEIRAAQTAQQVQEAMDGVIRRLRDKRDISEQSIANLLASVETLLGLSRDIVQCCNYTEAVSKTNAVFRVIIAMHEMVGQHRAIRDKIDETFWYLGVYQTGMEKGNR